MDKKEPKSTDVFIPIKRALDQAFSELDKAHVDPATGFDLDSGYAFLNQLLIGLGEPCLSIISVPETPSSPSLGVLIGTNIAPTYDRAISYFSMGASTLNIATQMLSVKSRIDHLKIVSGKVPSEKWPILSHAAGDLSESNLYIDDSRALTVQSISEKLEGLMADTEIDLVIVDNLQLLESAEDDTLSTKSEQRSLRELRELSEKLRVSVLVLSSTNEYYESSQVQNRWRSIVDAELYMLGGVQDEMKPPISLNVKFNRNGPTGVIKLT